MSHPTIAVLVGAVYALAVIAFLGIAVVLCKAAAQGDDAARRLLGPPSSADEHLAASSLYPSRGRDVAAVSKKPPAALDTSRGQTHRGDISNEHR